MTKQIALGLSILMASSLANADGTTVTAAANVSATAKSVAAKKKPKKVAPKAVALGISATAKPSAEALSTTAAAPAKKEHWVCPMGDGGESDHAGKCPKCGMDLVLEN